MPLPSNLRFFVFLAISLLSAGCVTAPPYDYTALENSRPRSILVIPPRNDSIEVNASYIYLASVSRPLAEKGYYVFPVAVIDRFLKENGLPTPAEMNSIPLDKVREIIGADAVLYVTIEDWGQKYQILTSTTVVQANLRLVDTRTGDLIWDSRIVARRSSDDGDMGLFGAILNAVITQVANSDADATFRVSSMANYMAINNRSNGLLHGPYFNPDVTRYSDRPGMAGAGAQEADLGDEADLLHVGKAASEITARSYDPNLWHKSLALAGGDEDKRVGIYIRLRANQLAEIEKRKKSGKLAKLTSESTGSPMVVYDVSGTYVSELNGTGSGEFRRIHKTAKVTITQVGSKIKGTFGTGGEIEGILENDTITFDWYFSYMEGTGKWKISDNGQGMTGTWRRKQSGRRGEWNLKKIDSTPIALLATSGSNSEPAYFDLSGTYVSEITHEDLSPYQKPRSYFGRATNVKVTIEQNGDTVTGKISGDRRGEIISGTIEGNEITFEWYIEGGRGSPREGKGVWVISEDPSKLNGSWRDTGGADSKGIWNLTKIE